MENYLKTHFKLVDMLQIFKMFFCCTYARLHSSLSNSDPMQDITLN